MPIIKLSEVVAKMQAIAKFNIDYAKYTKLLERAMGFTK